MKSVRVFAVTAVLLVLFSVQIGAAEKSVYDSFSEEFDVLIGSMPQEIQAQYEDVFQTPEGIAEVEMGVRLSSVKEKIIMALEKAWPSAVSLLSRLLALILCAGLLHGIKRAFPAPHLESAFSLCTGLVFSITLADSVHTLLTNSLSYLQSLSDLSAAAAPIAAAVTAASGHLTAATVSHASLMLLFVLIQNITTAVLVPLVRLSYCFGIVSTVGKFVRIESISKFIRKTFTVVLAFVTVIVGFTISVQSVLAKSVDSLSLKTVKFALGNMIPLVGSAVADAVSTVAGGLGVIRAFSGGLCVLALLIFLLPVLAQLILHRLVLAVCQGMAEMLGCEQEGKMIAEIHGVLGCILAMVALMSVLFLLTIILFTFLGGSYYA